MRGAPARANASKIYQELRKIQKQHLQRAIYFPAFSCFPEFLILFGLSIEMRLP